MTQNGHRENDAAIPIEPLGVIGHQECSGPATPLLLSPSQALGIDGFLLPCCCIAHSIIAQLHTKTFRASLVAI
jgi:hypothetical protein